MSSIRSGQITAFYLFDVAELADLAGVTRLIPAETAQARLAPKPVTPAYVQYQQPPVVVDGDAVQMAELDGFKVRFKVYDYGVVSLALARPFSGSWVDLIAAGQAFIENDQLETRAEQYCRALVDRLRPAMTRPRAHFLTEDYLVFGVTALERPLTAEDLIDTHGEEIALLLRGERQALSRQERNEILRHWISYLADDLVVPTWNAALVYDTEAGLQAALEIFEFGNSQLLQFRYYDDLLDNELGRIYAELQRPKWYDAFAGRRYSQAAHQLHSLFIEVNELTDRTENALKMVGDIYAARLFNLVAARLGLDRWKENVEEKLETLDDIYRFAVEQTGMSRGHFLELTIVLILVFELVLFFIGIMR